MLITKPVYYDSFRCVADRCPDGCCKEWDVVVDGDTAAYYRDLPGSLGDDLREFMRTEDGLTLMTITDGRCPMWRRDGLCRIQAELGEGALCDTCRDFPRLRHDYGDFLELMLELSCPEAARLILSAPGAEPLVREVPGDGEGDYDAEAMAVLKDTRRKALDILSDESRDIGQTLAAFLLWGYRAQALLDGGEEEPFDPEEALQSIREFIKPGDTAGLLEVYRKLEILTPRWEERLCSPGELRWCEEVRPLARYLVERYWLQAVSDYDLGCRVKFMVVSCLVICTLGGDFTVTAQLYSKEIENNTDNVEALLDAAYADPAFTDDKLLGLLLS